MSFLNGEPVVWKIVRRIDNARIVIGLTPSSNQFQAKTRMNPNLAKVGKPTQWPPGKSGNPAGKPPGTRTAFSQGFIAIRAGLAEERLEAIRKVAKKILRLAIAAHLSRRCPAHA